MLLLYYFFSKFQVFNQYGPGRAPDGTAIPALSPYRLTARDSLRLEAGMPLYGHELTKKTTSANS